MNALFFLLLVLFLFVGAPIVIVWIAYRSDPHRHEKLANEAGRSTEPGIGESKGRQQDGLLDRPSTVLFVVSAMALALAIHDALHPSPPETHRTILGLIHMLLTPIFGNYTDAAFLLLGSVVLFAVAKHSRTTGR